MDADRAVLIRRIAEAVGYCAQERRPRESLNRFVEIVAPNGQVFGSAAGKQGIDEIIEMAWDDALGRLPDWTGNLNTAQADLAVFPAIVPPSHTPSKLTQI
jgi:hypothetical protein